MARLVIFISLLSVVFLYLGFRLTLGFSGAVAIAIWVGLFALLALLASYPLTWSRDHKGKALRHLRSVIHLDMGLMSFLFSFVLLRDIIGLPLLWLAPAWAERVWGVEGSAVVLALSILALIVGTYEANSGPRVKSVRVPIENLPEGLEGYKIAQISDLHAGPTIGLPYVERVAKMVEGLAPNLTVLTGDIADGKVEDFSRDVEPLRRLSKLGDALYVTGNHEYYWNGPQWISVFESLGIKPLLNSRTILKHQNEEVLVAGVVDPAARIANPMAKPDAKAALGEPNGAKLKILLSHHPGIARQAAEMGFDLQLSGHTHAGQFFPWTLVVSRVHEFSKGLARAGKMWVYVNPGTGSWGPPIRLGTRTEITLLSLVRA